MHERIECVVWHDARFELDPSECPEDYLVSTYGLVHQCSERFLHVVGEVLPDGERAVTHIHLSSVEDRIVLGKEEL